MVLLSAKFVSRLIIGILLVICLFVFVSPLAVVQSLQMINPLLVICAIIIYAFTFILLTIRWKRILIQMGESLPFIEAYQAFVGGVLYSDFTPGRIGDFSRAILVKKRITIHKATISVFIDRYIDIIVLTGLGCTALVVFASKFTSMFLVIGIIILIIIFIGVTGVYLQNSWVFTLLKKIPLYDLREFAGALQSALSEFRNGKKVIFEGIILTISAWITHAVRILLISMSLGYILPIPELFLILPLISALALIPISIAGLGLVEGGLMTVIAGYGIPASVAFSIAIIDRGITVFFHGVIGGWYAVKNTLE
jgi:uncharacterized protein (TIRG00374 family)